ncbi:UNVERIFIED_CONTAM: hypothetical protein FKN15_068095 [Acipenser sinensis]
MSWVKAVPSFGEDVFDEDMDDINLQQKEWKSNMEKRIKDGYRDGMDAGKEASLQHGFNQGYKEGASRMGVIGQLKGILRNQTLNLAAIPKGLTIAIQVGKLERTVARVKAQVQGHTKGVSHHQKL